VENERIEAGPVFELAARIARQLGTTDGVVAVVLGGSWARGRANPNPDIDVGIYYEPGHRPSIAKLRELARDIDDRRSGDVVTEYGAWGPWINGGAGYT